ncbi:MAG: hypothetical protein GF346_03275 [Candidatus Eisenbacteria bacterium]|nr:hypothetical protein [Candidatus Latescibacterota bacterium]MBD3301443.1 hypothetical protein [Candidatus Eisenbacteria bacterium]
MTTGGKNNGGTKGPDRLSPLARSAQEALQRLPRPSATDAARERARQAFVRGDAPPVAAPRPQEPRSWKRVFLPLTMAAGFAAAVLLVLWYGALPTEQWFITDVVQPDGIQVEADAALVKGARLGSGEIATAPGSEIEIQLGDRLRFRMLPEARLQLPDPPGRWFGRERTIELADGEIYGTTGGKPLPFELTVETDEATARIFGTTFAVLRLDIATCVCLWTGGVEVVAKDDGETTRLRDEMKYYVYKDQRPSEMVPIDDMERMKLSMTHDAGLAPIPEELE